MDSEATWTAVTIVALNMIGSVILTFLRLYFRAKYNTGEYERGKADGNNHNKTEEPKS